MKKLAVFAAVLLAATATPALAAPIIYTGVQQVGASTATLSITTDGTFGSLTITNILSVSATLTEGANSVSLLRDFQTNTGNASVTFSAAVRATATSLILPYLPDATNNEFGIYTSGFANWYAAGQGSTFSYSSQQSARIGSGTVFTAPFQGDFVLATAQAEAAVPEPATWGMMILGCGLVGASVRRRKSNVQTNVRFA